MKNKTPYVFIAPAAVIFILAVLLPLIMLVGYSFYKTDFIITKFVGLKNYAKIIQDRAFKTSLVNTFMYAGFNVVGTNVFALLAALFVYDMAKQAQDYLRFVLYVPSFTSGVVMAAAWKWIFHPTKEGLINYLIGRQVVWMFDRLTAILPISFIICLSFSGFAFTVYLAALLNVPKEIIDSAKMDGANLRQIKMRILLPNILPHISLLTLLSMIGGFQIYEYVLILAPHEFSASMLLNVYRTAFQYGRYGYASAKSVVMVLIVFAAGLIKRRIER